MQRKGSSYNNAIVGWTGLMRRLRRPTLRSHLLRECVQNGLRRVLSKPASRNRVRRSRQKKARPPCRGPGIFIGGVDGTRTRDPRRDRPVF